jgi:hypothetical protein
MPFFHPMKVLSVRYALSIACFLPWILLVGVKWASRRVQSGAFRSNRYIHSRGPPRWGLGAFQGNHVVRLFGFDCGLATFVDCPVAFSLEGWVSSAQWSGLVLNFSGWRWSLRANLGKADKPIG